MLTKITRRVLTGTVAAAGLTAVLAAPASAAPANSAEVNAPASVPCSNVPGHYCVVDVVHSSGNRLVLDAIASTGFTTGGGSGQERVIYTCNGGICGIRPTRVLHWGFDAKLTASHTGVGLRMPCGTKFGVAWLRTNSLHLAPGHPGNGSFQFIVTCNGGRSSAQRLS
jgi:hypothetical protein